MRIDRRRFGGVAAVFALILAGCGGSGGSTSGPPPTTVARASADSGVSQSLNPSASRVMVTWGVPGGIAPAIIVEYQILRSNAVIGVAQPGILTFTDGQNSPSFFVYQVPDAAGALIPSNGAHSPPEASNAFRYSVRALYRGNDGRHRFAVLTDSGFATPLARPGVNGPTTDQNLTRLQIDFHTVRGADQYVFEFSTSADFAGKVVRGPFAVVPTPTVSSQSEILDISKEFANVPGGTLIYFRVGARNIADTPGPISSDVPNGGGYIYSVENRAFRKIAAPPPAPN